MNLGEWVRHTPAAWRGMFRNGAALPSDREFADALRPGLEGRGIEEEVVRRILDLYEWQYPWRHVLGSLVRLYHEALDEADDLRRSTSWCTRADFADRRRRLGCSLVGAATILATQRQDVNLAARYAGIPEKLIQALRDWPPPLVAGMEMDGDET